MEIGFQLVKLVLNVSVSLLLAFSNVFNCPQVPGTETKGTAANLTAGKTYQFRVKAVNKGGPGEPSDETKPIVAKPRFCKPSRSKDVFR